MTEKQIKINERINKVNEILKFTDKQLEDLKKEVRELGVTTYKIKKEREIIYALRRQYRRELIDLVNDLFELEPIEE